MVRARVDKPSYKPMPKPPINIGDAIKEAAEAAGNSIKVGQKPKWDKPKMKDDDYKGEMGKEWEKMGEKLEKKIPEAPDLGDVLEGAVDAVGEAADRVADALNPFN